MKRPIKFRGVDKHGNFVFGEYAQAFMGGKPQICFFDERGWNCVPVDTDSIAQLVGYDSDGREVYEGDELDWRNGGGTIRIPQIYAKQHNYPLKEATKMKHSIREHIIDPVRGKIVKVSTVNAELGSGVLDKNGREIFEGDKLQVMKPIELRGEHCEYPETVNVEFTGGAFIAGDDYLDDLVDAYKDSVEIVGHADD